MMEADEEKRVTQAVDAELRAFEGVIGGEGGRGAGGNLIETEHDEDLLF
jgi:hypothetical protein